MLLFLTFSEDKSPPVIITNKGLFLDENSVKKITTLQLSATDQEAEPTELVYRIIREPQLGRLEHTVSPGKPIVSDFIRPKLGFSKCRGQHIMCVVHLQPAFVSMYFWHHYFWPLYTALHYT